MCGHHVSCFLSQLLGRRAQRVSIAAAFREHSPSRPSRPLACLAPPQCLYYKKIPNCQSLPAPPPPRPVFPRSLCPGRSAASRWLHSAHPAPLALKRSRTGAGASECDCGAAAGLCEGSGGKPGVELCRLPAARGRAGRGAQAGPGAQARPRTCPAGSLSAPRIRCASRSPHGQNLVVSTTSCFLGGFAGDQDGQHKQGYLDPAQPFLRVWVLRFLRLPF